MALAAAGASAALLMSAPALAAPAGPSQPTPVHEHYKGAAGEHAVCSVPSGLAAGCAAHVVVDSGGSPLATAAYTNGYAPSDLQSAYSLPSSTAGTGQTVAIVDAYDNPNVESDLAQYRAQFGLTTCDSTSGCFRKVDQTG
ncbi:MAG TPA: hypothetical protein VFH70_07980, partial [Acidimicrobiales bacterium]|nr:hypothetical protein [Acidimicrobiales bacterium]